LERCQSGLMGTPGKRVWVLKLTAGSNPVLSAKKTIKKGPHRGLYLFIF
tara:strand:+ start:204 stop:350 length:147 start_codon:yes stop_codon:yes gene_type:complete